MIKPLTIWWVCLGLTFLNQKWKLATRKSKLNEESKEPKTKSNPKQMDGKPLREPFVKTRKKNK